MKIRRLSLVVVVLLLVGVSAAVFLLPGHLARRAWDTAASRLSEHLGADITCRRVDFSLFSPLNLVDCALREAGETLAAVERVEVDVEHSSLIHGPIHVRRVLVFSPRLHIELDEGGLPAHAHLAERLQELFRGREPADISPRSAERRFGRLAPRVPQVRMLRGSAVIDGPGLAVYEGLLPHGRLHDDHVLIAPIKMELADHSLLVEDRLLILRAEAEIPTIDQRLSLEARYDQRRGEASVKLTPHHPITYVVGERQLSVTGVSYDSEYGLALRGIQLSEPLMGAERPFLRLRKLKIGLEEQAGEPTRAGLVGRLMAKVAEVELDEPEIFLSSSPDERTEIDDLGESFYLDELDARVREQVSEIVAPRAPRNAFEPVKRRAESERPLMPNGELVRERLKTLFGGVERGVETLTSTVHRLGATLPVRVVRVRKGRFLYREAAHDTESLGGRLYNFYLDAERQVPEGFFTFRLLFETPAADGHRNSVEGRIDLSSRDMHVDVRIEDLALDRYRPVLPRAFKTPPGARLYNTDIALNYSAERGALLTQGRLFLDGLEVASPAVALEPLAPLRVGVELSVAMDFEESVLQLDPVDLYFNDIHATVEGTVSDYSRAAQVDLRLRMPRTDLMTLVRSTPEALMPALQGLEMRGSLALEALLWLDTADLNTLRYRLDPRLRGLRVVSMGRQVDFKRIQERFVHEVEERDGSVTRFRVGPGADNWVPLEEVSPFVTAALTTTEDGTFYFHRGFSPMQIRSSVIANLERGRFYRGASTISQQLVKNLFLTRHKTIARKLQEVFITWQMEKHLSKELIMELYLNIIEWGPELYGIGPAAEYYFGKTPAELSLLDTAFLVSIIPNPRRFHHQFERGEVTPRWRARLRRIIEAMAARGRIDEADALAAAPYSPVFVGQEKPPALIPELKRSPPMRAPPPVSESPASPVGDEGVRRDGDIPLPTLF